MQLGAAAERWLDPLEGLIAAFVLQERMYSIYPSSSYEAATAVLDLTLGPATGKFPAVLDAKVRAARQTLRVLLAEPAREVGTDNPVMEAEGGSDERRIAG